MPGALPVPRFWWWPAAWLPPADRRADHALPRGQADCRAAGWRSHRERSFVMSDKTVVLAILDSEASADAAVRALKDSGAHRTRRRAGGGGEQPVRSFPGRAVAP